MVVVYGVGFTNLVIYPIIYMYIYNYIESYPIISGQIPSMKCGNLENPVP